MTKTEIEKPPSEDARERARAVVAELSGEDIYTNMVEDALAAAITAAELRGMRRAAEIADKVLAKHEADFVALEFSEITKPTLLKLAGGIKALKPLTAAIRAEAGKC